jgi:hypothetical protein
MDDKTADDTIEDDEEAWSCDEYKRSSSSLAAGGSADANRAAACGATVDGRCPAMRAARLTRIRALGADGDDENDDDEENPLDEDEAGGGRL